MITLPLDLLNTQKTGSFVLGGSMVGQSIILEAAKGDQIRLYNFGGDIFEEDTTREDFLHFIGVLLYSSDRK